MSSVCLCLSLSLSTYLTESSISLNHVIADISTLQKCSDIWFHPTLELFEDLS